MFKKLVLFFSVLALFLLALPNKAIASEGTFEMRNQVGDQARCYGTSILMSDQQYKLLISCRDILYPGGTEVFNYVVWSQPNSGGNAIRLGTLGLGKVEFKVKDAFSSLFVTKELNDRPRSPEGVVVMRGNLERILFLDNPQIVNTTGQIPNELVETESPSPSPITRITEGGNNIFRIIAAGGIVAFLGLFGVILIIFVVTRR